MTNIQDPRLTSSPPVFNFTSYLLSCGRSRRKGKKGKGCRLGDPLVGFQLDGFCCLHEIRDCRLPSHWTTSNSPIFASLRSLRAHLPSVFLPRFMNPPSIAAEFRNRICIHRDQPPLLNHRSSPDSRCN